MPTRPTRLALTGGTTLTPAGTLEPYTLLIEGTAITGLLPPDQPLPPNTKRLDVTGQIVAPGFIDTHVHGGLGHNFMEATPESLKAISTHMVKGGVTACLATTTSAAFQDLTKTLANAANAHKNPQPGQVELVGIHLEGPYVNQKFKGSHAAAFVRPIDLSELEALVDTAGSALKVVTLAPELPLGPEAVQLLIERGVQVSIGHTAASYSETRNFIARGVSRGTHLFNAMPPIHHREPGPVVALLESPTAYLELTVDGHHVAPAVISLVLRLAGPERVVLITDGADVAGQGDGSFTRWEGTPVQVKSGKALTESGSLAGSLLSLNQAVANLVKLVGVPLPQALRMASETPARSLGLLNRKGVFLPGRDADVVVLDHCLEVTQTIVRGQIAFNRRNSL